MRVWIDNTGLQSAGLCLDGTARAGLDYDVRGLLQLATLLIYSNRISLNGFEDDVVAKRSREIVDQLQDLGVTDDVISIDDVTEPEYALACKTTADSIAGDLYEGFNPDEASIIGVEPPSLPARLQRRHIEYIRLAKAKESSESLRDVAENALKDKAAGAIDYMLACSPKLRDALSQLLNQNSKWGNKEIYLLNSFLRYHLNQALAEQSFSKYAPAIARAELVDQRTQYSLALLGTMLDKTVAQLRDGPLGVPSTFAALLQRSKAEPAGILKVAMELRTRSEPIRNELEKLASRNAEDTEESILETHKQINELGHQLKRQLGLEPAAQLGDAVEVRFIVGIPIPSLSANQVVKWVRHQLQKKKTAVLTEIVKAALFAQSSRHLYDKLRKRSASNTVQPPPKSLIRR